jgi:hypothetical protein
MTNESENTQQLLDSVVARTSFVAIPKITLAGQARVDEIIRNASSVNVIDKQVLVSLLNTCASEATNAEIRFDGMTLREQSSSNAIDINLTFTVNRRLQIYDVFSGESIYRIPYEVFHPENFKLSLAATIATLHVSYNEVYPLKNDDSVLCWIHTFPSTPRLCLGTLGNTYRNEGLDGTFMAKLLSSFACVNLNSPARALLEDRLEPEYNKLAKDCCGDAAMGQAVYRTWRDLSENGNSV